jgi:hypothetical protein
MFIKFAHEKEPLLYPGTGESSTHSYVLFFLTSDSHRGSLPLTVRNELYFHVGFEVLAAVVMESSALWEGARGSIRHYATSRKVADSNPKDVIFFN